VSHGMSTSAAGAAGTGPALMAACEAPNPFTTDSTQQVTAPPARKAIAAMMRPIMIKAPNA